ncbi:MAG: lysylphosphatidylglycerol synthase transmembrane domain-containing protein [Vicinamibacterales bacterium]
MPYSQAVSSEGWSARIWQLAAAVIGLLLLGAMIRSVGADEVRRGLASVGAWFLAVVALGGIRFAARARSWMICAEDELGALRFSDAFSAVLSADALGNVTPLGLLASEPAKVLLVRRRLSTAAGVSSVAADNVFYTLSVLLIISAGTVVFLRRAPVPPAVRLGGDVVLLAALLALSVGVWAGRTRPAVLSRLAVVASRIGQRARIPSDRLVEVEQRFYALLSWPTRRLARIAGWLALFHVAAIAEVYLVMSALPIVGGASLIDAFLLESAGRLIVVAFKFIPYRLGVDEAGSALVARQLGFDPMVGVTMALVRKLRTLAWNAVGAVLLASRR